jgi:hypothetical protein
MTNEYHRTLIDRATRMLRESKALRKMSAELRKESEDVRKSAKLLKNESPRSRAKPL